MFRATGDVDAEETTRAVAEESVVEFVLCTRTKGSPASAPRGVVLHALPPTLFVLLSSAHIHTVALSLLLKPALQPAPDAAKDGNDDADVESKVTGNYGTRVRRPRPAVLHLFHTLN